MKSSRASWIILPLRLATALPLLVALTPTLVCAQNAADKATARELAVNGIKEYKEGQYRSALDRLQRAQALYDAHVHLVYIARCHAQLGQLVEAAEAYRALARKPLPMDASDAVRQAQTEGAQELAALEPRIPKLRIDVQPANAKDLKISINGAEVPAAIVGIDRPANPGEHVIRVGAPGYKNAEAKVVLKERDKNVIAIELEAGEGGPPVLDEAGTLVGGGGGEGSKRSAAPPPPKPVSFIIEPRLSAFLPVGNIGDESASKVVAGGAGGELRFGVHFKKRYTGILLVQAHGLKPLSGFDAYGYNEDSGYVASASTSTVAMVSGGAGFMFSTPHHQLGWFAEGDILGEFMAGKTDIQFNDRAPSSYEHCSTETSFAGGSFRLSGGGVIPLSQLLQLTPYLSASLSSYPRAKLGGDCEQQSTVDVGTIHGWLGIGVGGQFMLGE